MRKIVRNKLDAFSLLEVLIVLVIIGILVLLALPDQTKVVTKAKATEAKLQLQHIYSLERAYFFEYGKYTDDFDQLGFTQEKLITDDGNAYYLISIDKMSTSGFVALATSVSDFDNDGVFNVWSIDENKNLRESQPD